MDDDLAELEHLCRRHRMTYLISPMQKIVYLMSDIGAFPGIHDAIKFIKTLEEDDVDAP